MKFRQEWLATYLPGEPPPTARLRERLTAVGFVVETVEGDGPSAVLDVEITANRPDAMNHRGLAREAAVALHREFRDPEAGRPVPEGETPVAALAKVVVEEPTLCGRYSARVVEGLRVRPAGAAVGERLAALGAGLISSPVDATNHVLWDVGQPLHAFDLDKLAKDADGLPTIVVRRARPGEKLVTLDGVERTLAAEHLVIADAKRPVALAGIMGGLDTAISERTTRILLESAHFDPGVVRRGARLLGMHTDASHRFERGADPEATVEGLERAVRLIVADGGGTVAKGLIDVRRAPRAARTLVLRMNHLHAFLGIAIPPARCEEIFEQLGFRPVPVDGTLRVAVPSWRVDVEAEVDLVEEAIRCEGYDRLPETLPAPYVPAKDRRAFAFEDRVRDLLAAQGLLEASTYSFVSEEENRPFEAAAPGAPVVLENPLAEPFSTMRATPVIGLLESARHNVRRGNRDLGLFEVAHAYGRIGTAGPLEERIREERRVALLLTGRRRRHWSETPAEVDFFDGSGAVTALFRGLALPDPAFEAAALPFLAPGRAAAVLAADGARLGWVGVLAAPLSAAWDLEDPVVADLDLGLVARRIPPPPDAVEAPPRLPGSEVDLTVTHALSVPWRELASRVRDGAPPELVAVEAKGRYRGAGVADGFVKTTLTLRFGSPSRSLAREEINAWRDAAAARLLALPATKVDGIPAPGA
ncbi:MAG TPA: phenylalanine--tRNA ligase subunit beta [Thermoanaerobaculia bacterium]|nr:phenylalanine--tRNA ligase subunit beta [Thermoanaerobaculia bacterium]